MNSRPSTAFTTSIFRRLHEYSGPTAEFTIAIDVAFRPYEEPISGITGVAFQMFHIMVNRLIDEQIKRADFAIRLDVHQIMRDEGGLPALIRAGEEAVLRCWPALQQALRAAGTELPHR